MKPHTHQEEIALANCVTVLVRHLARALVNRQVRFDPRNSRLRVGEILPAQLNTPECALDRGSFAVRGPFAVATLRICEVRVRLNQNWRVVLAPEKTNASRGYDLLGTILRATALRSSA